MRLSKSKCLSYLSCPHRFYLECIKGIRPKEKPAAMRRGIEIHTLAEVFYSQNNLELATEKLKEHPFYRLHEQASNNIIKFATQKMPTKFIVPKVVEKKMFNKELNFSGIIDVVFEIEDDIIILDWKTGKTHPIEDYRFELSLYHYLLKEEEGINATHYGIFFIDHDKLIVEKANERVVEWSKKEVERIRAEINKGDFEKKPSWMCNWCSVKEYCKNG